jgi:glycosyltransferase involved in cell wall biosynthesis
MGQVRVVHLLGALYPSGMERMLVSAANEFASQDVRALVVGQGSVHPFHRALIEADYEVALIPKVRSLRGMLALYRVIRDYAPDLVHIHTESAFLQAVLVAKLSCRVPIVRTIHSVFRPSGRARISRRVQAFFADRFVASFVAPSPEVVENETAWNRSSRLIFNWVSREYIEEGSRSAAIERNPKIAVLVGNCAPVKNHELALNALTSNGYIVAHHGSEQGASGVERDLLDNLARERRLKYRGREAPLESLREAGVFVLPSLHEGMSVALAEAIAAGTPCLVADSTGLSWAKGIAGVQHIELSSDAWAEALPEAGYEPLPGKVPKPDLSPARGASEYSALYRTLVLGLDETIERGRESDRQ